MYKNQEEEDYIDNSDEQRELEEANLQLLKQRCAKKTEFSVQDWLDYVVLDISFSNLQYTEVTQVRKLSITFSKMSAQ